MTTTPELDALPHPARLRRVRLLARDAADPAALAARLASSGDAHGARLGLEVADVRDLAAVALAGLRHEAVSVRARAVRVAARVASDDQLTDEIVRAAPDTRRRLVQRLRRQGRQAVADRLLPHARARWGPVEAARLLSACASAAALPELAWAVPSWGRLAPAHADAVLAHVRGALEAAPPREVGATWARLAPAVDALALLRGAELLDLALRFVDGESLPPVVERHLGVWSALDPAKVTDLLLRPGPRARLAWGLPRRVLGAARRLGGPQLERLAVALAEHEDALAGLLRALPPSWREPLFERAFAGRELAAREWPTTLLEALPRARRDREVARMLALPACRDDPDRTLALLPYRDVAHVRPALEAACRAATAEERALAWQRLVQCTGRSRSGVDETLAALGRLRNEQDPVRLAALGALAAWPQGLWKDEHVPPLEDLARHVTEARDTSHASRGWLQQVAQRLLRAGAADPDGRRFQAGLRLLARLAGQAGALALPSLERDLPAGAEHRIVAALAPHLQAAQERESHALVLGLSAALGRRGHAVEALQALLEPVTRAVETWTARQAIERWLAPPRTRDARVTSLVLADPTTVAIEAVFRHLHRRRQDLLDPLLTGVPIQGRFLSGDTAYLLPAADGFWRWLPRQQAAFARLLERVATDGQRPDHERAGAIGALARIPIVEAAIFDRLIRSGHVPVVEAALSALAWTDRPQEALPVLLAHCEGERARVAMYAVPRCLRFLDPRQALGLLDQVLASRPKVTVHKEALRLLGELRTDEALARLVREAARPDLHRDVRIAVGHAARAFLDRPEGLTLLEGIARAEDRHLAASLLGRSPHGTPPAARGPWLERLLAVAGHADVRVRTKAWPDLAAWATGSEERVATAAAARVADLAGGGEWVAALAALVAVTRDGAGEQALRDLVRRLASTPGEPDAGPERDLPARQRLLALVEALASLPLGPRVARRATFRALASSLVTAEQGLWLEAARLRVQSIDWRDEAAAGAELIALATEVVAWPAWREPLARLVARALEGATTAWTPASALGLVDRLLVAPTPSQAQVALAVLGVAGRRAVWDAACRERLRALRRHPDPPVVAEARRMWTAKEP